MSRTLELTINAPCDWINANQRDHFHDRRRRTSAWREAANGAVRMAAFHEGIRSPAFTTPVHIVCTVHKTRAGRWDAGNLYPTAKAIVDGLVDAGVIPDDSNEWVTGPDMRAGEKRDRACVVVTVTEVAT